MILFTDEEAGLRGVESPSQDLLRERDRVGPNPV